MAHLVDLHNMHIIIINIKYNLYGRLTAKVNYLPIRLGLLISSVEAKLFRTRIVPKLLAFDGNTGPSFVIAIGGDLKNKRHFRTTKTMPYSTLKHLPWRPHTLMPCHCGSCWCCRGRSRRSRPIAHHTWGFWCQIWFAVINDWLWWRW